jgi:predicted porin
MFNLNLNISYSSTIGDTDTITQSEINLSDEVKNVTITTDYNLSKSIWSYISVPIVGVFHKVSVWTVVSGLVELTNYH